MDAFKANLTYWLNPLKWTRNLVFLALLLLDFQHTYEFFQSIQRNFQAHEVVPIFGSLFTWASIPMDNATFDSLAYAAMVTAVIFFVSNTLAKRLAHNHGGWMMPTALVVGVLISMLTNAGTMYYAATGSLIIPALALGPVAATLGAVVTAGLLMFASMDAWEMKARIEKGRATRKANATQKVVALDAAARRAKFTPRKYRQAQSA